MPGAVRPRSISAHPAPPAASMRNVWILTLAQAFAGCGTLMMVTFGGIVGVRIAPAPALATLPWTLTILGVAAASVPAALLMQRLGRRRVFVGAGLLGACAALLAAWAVANAHFAAFCAAGALLGVNQALALQFRFAATEYTPVESAGRAIGLVMMGTLAAAVIGPELGDRARLLGGWPEFTGSFITLAVLLTAGSAILTRLGEPPVRASPGNAPSRPLASLAVQPAFVVAVLASVSSYAVMSFIMTATPLSMHVVDGMSVAETKRVITAHLLAMYVPSLFSGWLTRVVGLRAMMLLGVAMMAACVGIAAFVGHHFVHYMWGLVLLGLGWNLLFVAGTTLLARTHTTGERFKAQGFNDLLTFGTQALASLLAASTLQAFGWGWLNLATVPLLAGMLAAIAWLRARGGQAAREFSRAGSP
jgi:MFS family permease